MLAGVNGALAPYVTSAFALHSLTPTVSIISSIIGGVMNLTLAKILDVFGRPQGYLFCVCLAVIGLAMTAACNSVEAYAAAQVFYTVGNNGIQYSLSVLIADTSSLQNRGLVLVSNLRLWIQVKHILTLHVQCSRLFRAPQVSLIAGLPVPFPPLS
jgi:MFS family permease